MANTEVTIRSTSSARQMLRPISLWLLVAALILQGVSGLGGGVVFLLDSSGSLMGLDTETLSGTPVACYLLPGLLLAIPPGLIPLPDSWALVRPSEYRWAQPLQRATGFHVAWLLSLAVGLGLILWIVVEYLLIGYQDLQAVFGLVGVIVLILTLVPPARQYFSTPERKESGWFGTPV